MKVHFIGGVFSWHMLLPTLASAAVPALTLALWALSPRALTTTSSATLAFPAALALAPAPWAPSLRANYQSLLTDACKKQHRISGAAFLSKYEYNIKYHI
jgi:hypothetical protein